MNMQEFAADTTSAARSNAGAAHPPQIAKRLRVGARPRRGARRGTKPRHALARLRLPHLHRHRLQICEKLAAVLKPRFEAKAATNAAVCIHCHGAAARGAGEAQRGAAGGCDVGVLQCDGRTHSLDAVCASVCNLRPCTVGKSRIAVKSLAQVQNLCACARTRRSRVAHSCSEPWKRDDSVSMASQPQRALQKIAQQVAVTLHQAASAAYEGSSRSRRAPATNAGPLAVSPAGVLLKSTSCVAHSVPRAGPQ